MGVRSPARTRLLVLLVEFFNHLGRLPSAQTHRNLPRRRSRQAEEAAGRPAPCSGAGWAALVSLWEKARPPRLSATLIPGGCGHALSSSPAGGGGAGRQVRGPAWWPLSKLVCTRCSPLPTLPAAEQPMPGVSRMRFYLVDAPSIATCAGFQSLETEARGLRGLFLLNDRGVFYKPLPGPSAAEGALPRRGSGGPLFQQR